MASQSRFANRSDWLAPSWDGRFGDFVEHLKNEGLSEGRVVPFGSARGIFCSGSIGRGSRSRPSITACNAASAAMTATVPA